MRGYKIKLLSYCGHRGKMAFILHRYITRTDGLKKEEPKPRNTRLQQRLLPIEQLGTTEKRQVLQSIDTMIEREQLIKKVTTG